MGDRHINSQDSMLSSQDLKKRKCELSYVLAPPFISIFRMIYWHLSTPAAVAHQIMFSQVNFEQFCFYLKCVYRYKKCPPKWAPALIFHFLRTTTSLRSSTISWTSSVTLTERFSEAVWLCWSNRGQNGVTWLSSGLCLIVVTLKWMTLKKLLMLMILKK